MADDENYKAPPPKLSEFLTNENRDKLLKAKDKSGLIIEGFTVQIKGEEKPAINVELSYDHNTYQWTMGAYAYKILYQAFGDDFRDWSNKKVEFTTEQVNNIETLIANPVEEGAVAA